MFTKDLSANVTLYGQQQCCWCGAASAQMTRNGYPNAGDRLWYSQQTLWNDIQARNSTAPADAGWCTDPHGLTGCLQNLSNPSGVHWVEFADTSRDSILFDILYWMNRREYPSPVLINQGGHWVVIVGYVTDVEPVAGSTPTLSTINFFDPEPHNVGTNTTMTDALWIGQNGPWDGPVGFAGTWLNQYVAVVEPPIEKGRVRVNRETRTGVRLLTPARALERARRWIDELKLADRPQYRLLGREDVEPLEPMLVREEREAKRSRNVPHYYIVPFGLRSEFDERGTRLARVCVLVNAYTGQFEEVTAFGQAMRFLSREEALDVVAAAMQMTRKTLKDAQVTLMFQASDITHVRTWPFWRVKIGNRTMYVDQLGKLYGKLLPSRPGD